MPKAETHPCHGSHWLLPKQNFGAAVTGHKPCRTIRNDTVLYHFIQLVSDVTRDRLDEILFSSFGSCSHDMQKFWEELDHNYIIYPPIRPLEKKKKKEKKIQPSKPFCHFPCYRVTSVTFSEFEGLCDA